MKPWRPRLPLTLCLWSFLVCTPELSAPAPAPAATSADAVAPLPSLSAERRAQLQKAFATFDKDGSGSLSPDELATILSAKEASEVIRKYDIDGNGLLDIDEFITWSTKDDYLATLAPASPAAAAPPPAATRHLAAAQRHHA